MEASAKAERIPGTP